ncbi:MAG: hypothetical protein L0Z55_05110 [Planctomycetes bacterium]|nr:hypothetical protein [Planctomycetota bacterium]
MDRLEVARWADDSLADEGKGYGGGVMMELTAGRRARLAGLASFLQGAAREAGFGGAVVLDPPESVSQRTIDCSCE